MTPLILSIFLIGTATCQDEIPSFTWTEDSVHPSPILKIIFPNGEEDFALLEAYNPIPAAASEREEDVDSCIYHGYLAGEEGVYVTLAGCVNSDNFDIQFRSQRLNKHMFEIRDGEAQAIQFEDWMNTADDAVQIQDLDRMEQVSNRGLDPAGYNLKIKIYYDENFKAKFGDDTINTIRRMIAFTQNNFRLPSLTTTFNLIVHPDIEAIAGKYSPDDIKKMGETFSKDSSVNSHVFLTKSDEDDMLMTRGKGYLGGLCHKRVNQRTNVNEYWGSDLKAATTVTHEIGHNLGIKHDFLDGNIPRTDSTGKACTGIQSIMDYGNDRDKWSTCSVEDLTKYVNKFKTFCLSTIDA